MLHLYENRPEMVHYYITYARVEQITKRYSQREGKKRSTLKETNLKIDFYRTRTHKKVRIVIRYHSTFVYNSLLLINK